VLQNLDRVNGPADKTELRISVYNPYISDYEIR